MKKIFFVTLFTLILSLSPISLLVNVSAVDPAGTSGLNVFVKSATNDPIPAINITLTGPSSYSNNADTDTTGESTFSSLAAGDYTAVINLTESDPYVLKTGEQASKTVALADGETKNITFTVTSKTPTDETTTPTDLQLPDAFTQTGSTSTNLTKYTDAQLKAIKNFTLHVPGFAKILFKQPIDLSKSKDKISQMDQFVFLQNLGQVSVASELAPELDKPATVTLYGLKYNPIGENYTPLITKDNQVPTDTEVKNVKLVGTDSITFDVAGFSTYSLKPILHFNQTAITADTQNYTLQGQVDDLNSKIAVSVNGNRTGQTIEVATDGTFNADLTLKRGDNQVEVSATGIAEQVTTSDLTIKYGSATNSSFSSNLTLIMGIVLVIGGVIFGGYYLYKTKYLPKKRKSNTVKIQSSYDSRLLTPEERRVFNDEKPEPGDDVN